VRGPVANQLGPGAVGIGYGDRLVVRPNPTGLQGGGSFADVLAAQLGVDGIRVSSHAQQRLRQSEDQIGPNAAGRLKSAVERAEEKGSKDSLILLDDLAFVVSVKNKTIVTAVDNRRAREGVFTNIDSVVIG
jgi:flagellar operon protein